jgi:uncharacterized cupin superfamily protein
MSSIVSFDLPSTPPVVDQPRPERREQGVPNRSTWTVYESSPAGLAAGIWDSEPGRWRIEMGPTEHEYMVVLQGLARLHDENGQVTEVGPGQAVVIPPNFRGSFEVVEAVRKHFVIIEN